ncbi:hypothetical protein BGZ49_001862 [Haplosporangium sp. Z 27]|nr:hypothetical protein BGZ49_001862 [Haplosporangium sp. Z 27]
MHASLVEKDTREDVLLIKDTRSKEDMHLFKDNRTKATTGSSVSSLYPLKDFEGSGTESGFFVFPDLSVRMEGTYRLKFSLYEMVGKEVHFCAHVISDPLVVYSAKKFPGMEESTRLSQYFAEQGLKIRIRKEVRPKKRTRGDIAAPSSQSPTDSQHHDTGDATESQDDEEQTRTKDMPLTSKRRTSGSKNIESRREDHSIVPQKSMVQFGVSDTGRSNQSNRAIEQWRSQAPEYSQHQSMSNVEDRPGSAPEPYPQQHGYSRDKIFAHHTPVANKSSESVSQMDLNTVPSVYNSNAHSDQMDGCCTRPQDQVPATLDRGMAGLPSSRPDSLVPYRPSNFTKQSVMPPTSSLKGQYLDQRSTELSAMDRSPTTHQARYNTGSLAGYRDEVRRGSNGEIRSDSGADSSYMNNSRTAVDPQWPQKQPFEEHVRDPQTQSYTRSAAMETSYTTYPPHQGYTSVIGQRQSDSIISGPYIEDQQRGSTVPIYDRVDHQSRPQSDTLSQRKSPFHSVPQYPHHSRDGQYADNQKYPPQDQHLTRTRPASHHDTFPGLQHQPASYPQTASHGKYSGVDAPAPQGGDHGQSGRYPSFPSETMTSQGRYPPHSHASHLGGMAASAEHGHHESLEAPRRSPLTSSPPRSSDIRPQHITQFSRAGPTLTKTYGHDSASCHSVHPSSGHSMYQDEGPQAVSGVATTSHHQRGTAASDPYLGRFPEPSAHPTKDTLPRQTSSDYNLDDHSHGRGRPPSTSRLSHAPISTVVTSSLPLDRHPGSASELGPSRGPGYYDRHEENQERHYTTTHPSTHDLAPGSIGGGGGGGRAYEHGYKQGFSSAPPLPSSGLMSGHGIPGPQSYGQSGMYPNSQIETVPSAQSHGHQQYQPHGYHRMGA